MEPGETIINEDMGQGQQQPGMPMAAPDYTSASSNLMMWSLDPVETLEAMKHVIAGDSKRIKFTPSAKIQEKIRRTT